MHLSFISSSDRGSIFRRTLAILVLAGWCVLGTSWILLWRTGETDLDRTVREQIATSGMANLLSVPFYTYKRAMYLAIRPEVTDLGTSRSLQFRSYMFRKSFYNLGGGSKDIDADFAIADDLFKRNPPKLLILALDIWTFWADRRVTQEQARRPHGLPPAPTSINPLILPFDLLLKGQLSWHQIIAVFRNRNASPVPAFGLYAYAQASGFAADGSGLQIHRLDKELLLPARQRFRDTLDTIGQPGTQLLPGPGDAVDGRQIRLLRQFIDEMRTSGTIVVPVMVPVSPMVMSAMKASAAYGYIAKARPELARSIPELLDLLDPQIIGSSDCEFYDGNHGGEITYARILLEISKIRPELAQYFDIALLREVVSKYAGYSTAPIGPIEKAYAARFYRYFDATACHS